MHNTCKTSRRVHTVHNLHFSHLKKSSKFFCHFFWQFFIKTFSSHLNKSSRVFFCHSNFWQFLFKKKNKEVSYFIVTAVRRGVIFYENNFFVFYFHLCSLGYSLSSSFILFQVKLNIFLVYVLIFVHFGFWTAAKTQKRQKLIFLKHMFVFILLELEYFGFQNSKHHFFVFNFYVSLFWFLYKNTKISKLFYFRRFVFILFLVYFGFERAQEHKTCFFVCSFICKLFCFLAFKNTNMHSHMCEQRSKQFFFFQCLFLARSSINLRGDAVKGGALDHKKCGAGEKPKGGEKNHDFTEVSRS